MAGDPEILRQLAVMQNEAAGMSSGAANYPGMNAARYQPAFQTGFSTLDTLAGLAYINMALNKSGFPRADIMPGRIPGMSPYQSMYAGTTSMAFGRQAQWGAGDLMGSGLGNDLFSAYRNMGGRGADLNAFQAPAMAAGRFGLLGLLPTSLTGGNFQAYASANMNNRQALGYFGNAWNPNDPKQQTSVAKNVVDFNAAMYQGMYGNPVTGKPGIIPNMAYTRGFDVNAVQSLTDQLVGNKGSGLSQAVAGGKPQQAKEIVGNYLKTLESVRELMQSDDMYELMDTMSKMTNDKFFGMNPAQMEKMKGQMRQMTAMATLNGVDSRSFVQMGMGAQQLAASAMGVPRTASGTIMGGAGGSAVTKFMGNQVTSILAAEGLAPVGSQAMIDTYKRRGLDVSAQQAAFLGTASRTTTGRAGLLVALARQDPAEMRRLGIRKADIDSLDTAMATGDISLRDAAYKKLFRGSKFGSLEAAAQIMAQPGMWEATAARVGDQGMAQYMQGLTNAGAGEYKFQQESVISRFGYNQARVFAARAGRTIGETDPGLRAAQAKSMIAALRAKGGDAADLANVMEARWGEGGDAGWRNMQAVRTSVAAAGYKDVLENASNTAGRDYILKEVGGTGNAKGAGVLAQLNEFTKLAGTPANAVEAKKQRDAIANTRKALRDGRPVAAAGMMEKLLGTVKDPSTRKLLENIGAKARADQLHMADAIPAGESGGAFEEALTEKGMPVGQAGFLASVQKANAAGAGKQFAADVLAAGMGAVNDANTDAYLTTAQRFERAAVSGKGVDVNAILGFGANAFGSADGKDAGTTSSDGVKKVSGKESQPIKLTMTVTNWKDGTFTGTADSSLIDQLQGLKA